jgi:hypothetical protein
MHTWELTWAGATQSEVEQKVTLNGKTVYIHIFSHDYTRRNAMLSDAEYVHCIFFFLFPLIIDFFFEVYAEEKWQ